VKRIAVIVLLAVACSKETRTPQKAPAPQHPSTPAPRTPVTSSPRHPVLSTPQKCAGDGSYEQAVECFRMAAKLRFTVDAPTFSGDGTMTRPRIGEEHVDLSLRDGKWSAAPQSNGLVWTYDGQHATPPPELERLQQRLTLFLDPQKKEGAPQLAGKEPIAGITTNHFRFTDANNGEPYDVWVSTTDGHIVQMTVGKLRMAFR